MSPREVRRPADGERGPVGPAELAGGDHLLTVSEVAAVLRVSTMTVRRLIARGELGATRVNRDYRVWARALERFITGHEVGRG